MKAREYNGQNITRVTTEMQTLVWVYNYDSYNSLSKMQKKNRHQSSEKMLIVLFQKLQVFESWSV